MIFPHEAIEAIGPYAIMAGEAKVCRCGVDSNHGPYVTFGFDDADKAKQFSGKHRVIIIAIEVADDEELVNQDKKQLLEDGVDA